MKKGTKVQISENATKSWVRSGGWTEQNLYGKVTIPAGTKMYHVSPEKILAFAPIETCFDVTPDGMGNGHVYILNLKKDVVFEQYDNADFRVDLSTISDEVADIVYAVYGDRKLAIISTEK